MDKPSGRAVDVVVQYVTLGHLPPPGLWQVLPALIAKGRLRLWLSDDGNHTLTVGAAAHAAPGVAISQQVVAYIGALLANALMGHLKVSAEEALDLADKPDQLCHAAEDVGLDPHRVAFLQGIAPPTRRVARPRRRS